MLERLEKELGCELLLLWEETGEEVGYPNVEIVGLYTGIGIHQNKRFFIDAKNKVILETFVVRD